MASFHVELTAEQVRSLWNLLDVFDEDETPKGSFALTFDTEVNGKNNQIALIRHGEMDPVGTVECLEIVQGPE